MYRCAVWNDHSVQVWRDGYSHGVQLWCLLCTGVCEGSLQGTKATDRYQNSTFFKAINLSINCGTDKNKSCARQTKREACICTGTHGNLFVN